MEIVGRLAYLAGDARDCARLIVLQQYLCCCSQKCNEPQRERESSTQLRYRPKRNGYAIQIFL